MSGFSAPKALLSGTVLQVHDSLTVRGKPSAEGKMTSTIGIPIKLLNEAQNHVVTLEITSGQVYRGKLIEAEDNMNVQLRDITVTARDGRVSHLDQVYIRGSHVRFFIVPDMLRNAPMFRSRGVRGRGVGMARGRATVNRARGQRGGRGGG
ncbi:MAG: hypothetical protein Q9202_005834 [Teloschistes flavicans]